MNEFEFSVADKQTVFFWPGTDLTITTAAGYSDILQGIAETRQLSAYALETMIYRTEEIIETDKRVTPVRGTAHSPDPLLRSLSNRYFDGAETLSDREIETVFNRLADDVSYATRIYTTEELTEIACLVFIREITHHLSVQAINL